MSARTVHSAGFIPDRSPVGFGQAWRTFRAMLEARRTRRILADMDGRMLADIGVGPGDALIEAERPMWDVAPRRR